MTPWFSNLLSSSPTTSLKANVSLRGLRNLRLAPSCRINVALTVTQWPNSGLKISLFTFIRSCRALGIPGSCSIAATVPYL